jgi:arylsulfatase A-like enzyme
VGVIFWDWSIVRASEHEGRTRVPFIVKEPGMSSSTVSTNASAIPKVIKAFAYVDDVTPTILDYAGVHPAGPTYKGHPVQ